MLTTTTIFSQSTVLICTASCHFQTRSPVLLRHLRQNVPRATSGSRRSASVSRTTPPTSATTPSWAPTTGSPRARRASARARSTRPAPSGRGARYRRGGGPCYLKTARENVTPGLADYVSGSKHCALPEQRGNHGTGRGCMIWYNRNILKYPPY